MRISFVAGRVLIAAGALVYGLPGVLGQSGSRDPLQAFHHQLGTWPSRLVATCVYVVLAVLVYVLVRRALGPARKPLRAELVAVGLFVVLELVTATVTFAWLMFMCLAVTWFYILVHTILPRLGGLPDRLDELADPALRRERLAARRRSSRRGARLQRTLEAALHEREAPRR